ncbi:unnamed protein product [Ceutorhynchus assimilis]|uniref:Uncharacterized protein n=1 Tax=Ceutorhynchus assimilis TaxID=467358 RepID=A0A9N9QJ93_9CUCU|nr:unnamed protein product [Ceutorhynchus assimilis]
MNCTICEERKTKDVFDCDGCKKPICKQCGELSSSEIKVLELKGKRVMKFYCPNCTKHDTFMLLHEIINTKNSLIIDKNEIISLLKEKIEDLEKLNEDVASNKLSLKSYASVLNNSKTTKKVNVPSLIIRPIRKQEVSKTREDITKTINPANLNVGIKNTRFTGNGNMIINCPSRQDVEQLKKAAEDMLVNDYEVTTTKMIKPKIKIPGYEGIKSEKEVEESIRKQNTWIKDADYIKVTYLRKKKNESSTILAECSSDFFHKCMIHKKINVEWNRCPIYEDLSVTRCFNCQEFYHKKQACDRKKVCDFCAEEHEEQECRKVNLKCNNCMQANQKFKTNYAITHASSNPECPSYIYHLEKLKNKIDYST